jgi:hypothetical protein
MEEGIFTWMVASQHPLRIGRTQSGLARILSSLFLAHWPNPKPWMVASQHPLRIGRTQSPAQQFLLLGFFAFRILTRASS